MMEFKEYIKANSESFQVLSVSTNKVLAFSYKEKSYIVKKQALPDDGLSPFWQMMKDVFGSGFEKQRSCMKTICGLLLKNPHIPPARFVLANEAEKLQVFEQMPGKGWEPDEFPEGGNIACQLGRFIGFNHSRSYEGFDLPGVGISDLHDRIMRHMEAVISSHWNGAGALDQCVRAYYEKLKAAPVSRGGLSLIMADISANQFLFDGDRITACVDLDAYVLGPIAWELALIQNCVKDMESFKRGYEEYQSFPNIKEACDFYVFLMALNDIWGKEEMRKFLVK